MVIVDAGWDLFETTQPTTFMGVSFTGVPLGNFDFGGTAGNQSTGSSDTIIERQGPATVPNTPPSDTAPPIDIEFVGLQLKSVDPADFGAGLDDHFITLQPGTPSTGQMSITFDDVFGGTFDSFINVAFDLRIGALNGPIIFSDVLQLSANSVPWGRTAPPEAFLINGVNYLLNGFDNTADFWAGGPNGGPWSSFTEQHPSGAKHTVHTATVPEPGSLLLFGSGFVGLIGSRSRRANSLFL